MLKETIYSPQHRFKEVFSLRKMVSDLNEARFLGTQLFIRDRKGMFRQSFLGIIWAFLPPFFSAAVWIFLNSSGAVKIESPGIPYPIFVFCGTLLFQTFTEAMTTPVQTVNAGKSMMAKLNFPREAFLISSFFTLLFNFFFKFLALIIIALAFNVNFTWSMTLFIPGVLAIILLGMSIGIFLIPFQMLFQDFSRMIALGSQVLMYLTPVVYPIPQSGFLRTINIYNPITPFIDIPRNWFVGASVHGLTPFFVYIGIAFVLTLFGWMLYRVTMPIIIERVGN
jgi:lipopolysaccharide transport system permease protein